MESNLYSTRTCPSTRIRILGFLSALVSSLALVAALAGNSIAEQTSAPDVVSTEKTTSAAFTTVADTVKQAIVSEDLHRATLARLEVAGQWKETKHASAWSTLQANSGKKGYCEACHSVNNNGNGTADTLAGWRTTKSAPDSYWSDATR